MFNLENTGGTYERQPNSTHVVSLWHIPGGTEYTDAKTTTVFFSDEASAKAFEKTWNMPPEMAMCMKVVAWDRIQKIHLDKQPCGECGQYKDSHIDEIDAMPNQCNAWISPEDRANQIGRELDQEDGGYPPPPTGVSLETLLNKGN